MKRAVALGFFDGVHIGHGALLRRTSEAARASSLSPCVMTYSNHPSSVLSGSSVSLINTAEERASLISELYGISDIVIKDFTPEYAALPCEEFFEKILINELSAGHVVAGYDFRFGRGGSGDAEKLEKLCKEHGLGCDIIEEVTYDGAEVSSSRIRELLESGDIKKANALLGHPHCTFSEVLHGQALGKKLGFATVNQRLSAETIIPRRGVYISRVTVDGKILRGVTNVGVRPSVSNDNKISVETHILDFDGDLYGKKIKTEFIRFLRDEIKFSTQDELLRQISQDVLAARYEN